MASNEQHSTKIDEHLNRAIAQMEGISANIFSGVISGSILALFAFIGAVPFYHANPENRSHFIFSLIGKRASLEPAIERPCATIEIGERAHPGQRFRLVPTTQAVSVDMISIDYTDIENESQHN